MKKLLLYTFIISVVFLSSCSKDSSSNGTTGGGGNNTTIAKKIGDIYRAEDSYDYVSYDNGQTWEQIGHYVSDNRLFERWHWNDEKITSLDHYFNGQYEYTYDFSYNSEGLVSQIIRDWEGVERIAITYNNKVLNKFEAYWDGIMQSAWRFEYSNGKISKIRCEYWNPDELTASHCDLLFTLLKIDVKKIADGSLSKDQLPIIELTWSGNNVRKMEYNFPESTFVESYVYDNKKNPYYGGNTLFATILIDDDFSKLSENNISYRTSTENGETYNYSYSYNYYEDYPMRMSYTSEYTHTSSGSMYKYVDTYTYSYSYLTE